MGLTQCRCIHDIQEPKPKKISDEGGLRGADLSPKIMPRWIRYIDHNRFSTYWFNLATGEISWKEPDTCISDPSTLSVASYPIRIIEESSEKRLGSGRIHNTVMEALKEYGRPDGLEFEERSMIRYQTTSW
ncbi:hypothetical protein AAMO2058_000441700 [Amorphochlora amoebiformis]